MTNADGYFEAIERIDILQKRIDRINGFAAQVAAMVPCSCDFTEQGQHLGCPAYHAQLLVKKISKFATKHPCRTV